MLIALSVPSAANCTCSADKPTTLRTDNVAVPLLSVAVMRPLGAITKLLGVALLGNITPMTNEALLMLSTGLVVSDILTGTILMMLGGVVSLLL